MEFEQPAFATLANTFCEMSMFADPSLNVLRAYGPVFKFTGREAEEIEGQELFGLFAPDSATQLSTLMNPMRTRVQKNATDEEKPLDDEILHLKNLSLITATSSILVEVKVVPRRDAALGGGAYYYMVTLNDLSYTKDLEKKKNSFFATMNHELRTPLNGIIGLTESLRSGEKDKARKKHFDMMLNSAQCMLKLVNNILDTASMRNNAADLDLSQVKINHLVEEIVELMKIAVDKRGRKLKKDTVDISIELDDDLDAIDMDKTKMFDALEAIVNNALKFTHKGSVLIKTTEDPETHGVKIMIEDTGIGISKDAIERIFDAFEQEDDDHENRKFEGLGLGLTLAKEVIALHGGKLWVESEVGAGSKFFITLPPNVRALKLISEKQRSAMTGATASGANGQQGASSGITQEERDRMELIRVKQAEQIDLLQREVLAGMKAISHLTIDLELFEEKFKLYNQDPRTLGLRRIPTTQDQSSRNSQLSVASHFLSNKMRSYEMPLADGTKGAPPSRLHRNFGVGTNFVYNNY
jgi:signal transduction histidine kinase